MSEEAEERRPQTADWVASWTTVALIVTSQFVERGDRPLVRAVGLAALALAVVFIFGPFFHLSRHGRVEGGKSYVHTTAVVDRGLYAIARHPQYLGYCFLVIGFALINQHPFTLALAVIGVVFFYLQMISEERYLVKRMGAEYEAYMERVPRTNLIVGIYRYLRSKTGSESD